MGRIKIWVLAVQAITILTILMVGAQSSNGAENDQSLIYRTSSSSTPAPVAKPQLKSTPIAKPGASTKVNPTVVTQNGPRISINSMLFDAGKVAPGSTLTHNFPITNLGNQDLQIFKVTPGCGCTIAQADQVIRPGQTGSVSLKIRFYPDWAGRKVTQSAVVETNDPVSPYTSLSVKAEILPK